MEIVEQSPQYPLDRIQTAVLKKRRARMVAYLTDLLKEVIVRIPDDLSGHHQRLVDELKAKLIESFSFPTPRFTPVFGESFFLSIGPFGQVRYPITFEWRPHEEACEYVLSIEELNWVHRTTETRLSIEAGTCEFIQGEEYMWELVVHGDDEVITEESGFFNLADKRKLEDIQQVEAALHDMPDGLGKFLVFAGLLEQRAYYMEAVDYYSRAYELDPLHAIAYRIACCYDLLELDELKLFWNRRIPVEKSE
jgi:hypothetical protein